MNKIVIIEDDDDAWFLLKNLLILIGYERDRLVRFCSISEIGQPEVPPEIVLTDLELPDATGEASFKAVCKRYPFSPIIVITGNADSHLAVSLIKEGAQDYLLKSEIDARILGKSIQYAIERKRMTADYRRIFVTNPTPMYILDGETRDIVAVNDAAIDKYGYTREEFLQLNGIDMRPDEEVQRFRKHVSAPREDQYDAGVWKHKKKDGSVFAVHIFVHSTEFNGRYARMVVAIDVDRELQVERALEEKVRENEELLDRMTDAFFTVNENHEFTYVNSTFEKLLQKTRDELMGRNVWEMFPEAIGLKFYEGYHKAINERVNVFFEELLPNYGLWLYVKAYPLEKGLAVYFVDITEQKLAQEKLALEEQNLRAIINNTEDIIWSVDRSYNILSANEAFWQFLYKLTGKGRDEIIQADFNGDLFEAWAGMFDRAFAGETFKSVWTNNFDGEEFYSEISFNPIRSSGGEVVGVSCFSRDITQERRLQQKIVADGLNLKAMIDSTPDMVWSVNKDLRIIAANRAAFATIRDRTGGLKQPGDYIFNDSTDNDMVREWTAYYQRALNGENFVLSRQAGHGDDVSYTDVSFSPILTEEGEVMGVSCSARDVTAQRVYLQKIEAHNKQLHEIAWIQSHKVRNHVATMMGLVQLANVDNLADPSNRRVLEGIKESAEQLDAVIREINDLSQQMDR